MDSLSSSPSVTIGSSNNGNEWSLDDHVITSSDDHHNNNDDRSSPITIGPVSDSRAIPSKRDIVGSNGGAAASRNGSNSQFDEKKRIVKRTLRQQDEHDRVSELVELGIISAHASFNQPL
jgi:hypothetical protein